MEKLRQLLNNANLYLKKADHLTYITYPQVKDVKLLYLIISNLFKTVECSMNAVLYYDRLYKRLPAIPGAFNYELELFKAKCVNRYNIDRRFALLISDLKEITELNQNGPMAFSRGDKFVLCNKSYATKVLDLQKVKNYLAETKEFVAKVNKVVRY